MDLEHPVPWFPAWGVRLPSPIENVFSVVSVFNQWRPGNRWLLVAFEVVASEIHLWTTWYSLRRSEESGSMVAKTPDVEFLRKISGTHQISRAFDRAGLREGDENAWIVSLPDGEIGKEFGDFSIPRDTYNDLSIDAERLIEHLGGSLIPKRPIPSMQGLKRLGSEPDGELTSSMMEERFLSHMALSDL